MTHQSEAYSGATYEHDWRYEELAHMWSCDRGCLSVCDHDTPCGRHGKCPGPQTFVPYTEADDAW